MEQMNQIGQHLVGLQDRLTEIVDLGGVAVEYHPAFHICLLYTSDAADES